MGGCSFRGRSNRDDDDHYLEQSKSHGAVRPYEARPVLRWGGAEDFDLSESPWMISCVLEWLYAYEGVHIIPPVCGTMRDLVLEPGFEWRRPPHRLVVLGNVWSNDSPTPDWVVECY